MLTMNNERLSLITPDAHAGLNLAGELAEHLHTQLQAANDRVERPGGTNYLLPPPVPKEIIMEPGIALVTKVALTRPSAPSWSTKTTPGYSPWHLSNTLSVMNRLASNTVMSDSATPACLINWRNTPRTICGEALMLLLSAWLVTLFSLILMANFSPR